MLEDREIHARPLDVSILALSAAQLSHGRRQNFFHGGPHGYRPARFSTLNRCGSERPSDHLCNFASITSSTGNIYVYY